MTDPSGGFPRPGEPEWLRIVLSQAGPVARPGAPVPPLPGPKEGYHALTAITPDPVVIVDAALRVASVNEAFLRLFAGMHRDRVLGRSILQFLVEWERVRAANLVARFLDTGIWDIAELTALRPDGSTFPIEARCEMLRDAEGRFTGMLVLVRDLSARLEAEDPLRAIVAATSRVTGAEFFPSLVRHLAQILHVRFAAVAEMLPGGDSVRTVAFWSGDGLAENFTYSLAGTPCANVVGGDTCYYPEGVRQLFPQDAWLGEAGAEGYLGSPLTDSSGQVIGLLQVLDTAPIYRSRDVGSILRIFAARAAAELERLRIESALRQSEERLAAAVRGSRDGLFDADLVAGTVYCSPRFYEITGFSGREAELDLSPDGLLARVHPDDAGETHAVLARCLAEGRPVHHTCRWRTRDRGYRWFESRLDARVNALGSAVRLAGFVSDVTDLRREALLEEETGALAQVGGWELDLLTGALHWTPGAYRIFGVAPATYIPTLDSVLEFFTPDSRETASRLLERVMATGGAFDQVLAIELATGERRWIRALGRTDSDAGRPVRLHGALQDITQMRHLEEQLLQSQKLEGIGRLAGGVAHDFNNLLTAILGYCDLALGRVAATDPLRDDLLQIQKAGTSASTLTSQLLAFARRQVVAPRVLDLGALARELEPFVRRLVGPTVVTELHAEPGTWPVRMDPGPFEQVLMNLAINANDAMPGGGRFHLAIGNLPAAEVAGLDRPEVAEADWVRLVVTDEGAGMTEEVLQLAFEPFFTTKPQGKGTGLGLSTCHGIVKQAGGHIWATSRPGHGTSIVILLPRSREAISPPGPPAGTAVPPAGSETLLVLEDEPALRALAARTLRRVGYVVLEAASGAEALALAEANRESLALVVSDVVLPQMSGPDVARQLRDRLPGLPVLFVSGYAYDAIAEDVGTDGVDFLAKPYTPATLTAKVREVLDRPATVGIARRPPATRPPASRP